MNSPKYLLKFVTQPYYNYFETKPYFESGYIFEHNLNDNKRQIEGFSNNESKELLFILIIIIILFFLLK